MRIAVVERFTDPSRRCDLARIADDGDEIVLWDLADPEPRVAKALDLLRAIRAWFTLPVSRARRSELFRICTRMYGWRRAALARVPGWVRAVRDGEIDEVACYSLHHFELARWLARETGRPARQMLAHGTQYLGEFAFEMLGVVPYAYWLAEQGLLRYTVSTPDTACLYYFSPDHREVPVNRRYIAITEYPIAEIGKRRFDRFAFPNRLDTTQWAPPPYAEAYADDGRFHWPKPPLVVCNKTSEERYLGKQFSVNSLDVDSVLELVGALQSRYTVIYNRPRATDIVGDRAPTREVGDFEELQRAFPDVVTMQDLHADHPDLGFNELQLRVFATCRRFVSVLGGSSYLASWFGGTNIVYARRGWEVDCGAYDNWFGFFSNARVIAVASQRELMHAVRREFLDDDRRSV